MFSMLDFDANKVFAPSTPLKIILTRKRKYRQFYKWRFHRNYAFKQMFHSDKFTKRP